MVRAVQMFEAQGFAPFQARFNALDDEMATRIGCNIGSGIGGLPLIEQMHGRVRRHGRSRCTLAK